MVKRLHLIVNNFMSHKEEWNNLKLPILFENIDNAESMQVQLSGFSSTEEKYINLKREKRDDIVLVPKSNIDFGVTDMKITGIGI